MEPIERLTRLDDSGLRGLCEMLPVGATVIEIGCYAGTGTRVFLESGKVARLIAVDPWRNGYDPSDVASHAYDMAAVEAVFDRVTASWAGLVCKVKDTSQNASRGILNASADLVYIDGDHRAEAVAQDIRLYLPKVKPGGLLGGHDFRAGNRVREAVVKTLGELLGKFQLSFWPDSSWAVHLG